MSDDAESGEREVDAHLVIKRGHRGRYRFTITDNGVRITGDLTLAGADRANRSNDTPALARFKKTALTLAECLDVVRVKP